MSFFKEMMKACTYGSGFKVGTEKSNVFHIPVLGFW